MNEEKKMKSNEKLKTKEECGVIEYNKSTNNFGKVQFLTEIISAF